MKPENILLTKKSDSLNSIPKITDFGLSKFTNFGTKYNLSLHHTPGIVGTPLYAANEVFRNQEYNYKADYWSMGPILYEMISDKLRTKITSMQQLLDLFEKGSQLLNI